MLSSSNLQAITWANIDPDAPGRDLSNIWVNSWKCSCLVTWFCFQLTASSWSWRQNRIKRQTHPHDLTHMKSIGYKWVEQYQNLRKGVITMIQDINPSTYTRLILGLHPANERRCYKVTPSLTGWVQTKKQLWDICAWDVDLNIKIQNYRCKKNHALHIHCNCFLADMLTYYNIHDIIKSQWDHIFNSLWPSDAKLWLC